MNIAILNCGYIGSALAAFWKTKGHFITALAPTVKIAKTLGKSVNKCLLNKEADTAFFESLIQTHDLIILTMSTNYPPAFEKIPLPMAQALKQAAMNSRSPKSILFTSSSMIYGDHTGQWVDEKATFKKSDGKIKKLIETENSILSLKEQKWKVTILRLGEVYGPEREISTFVSSLEQKTLPGSGSEYTNMIHREDVIGAIDYMMNYHLEGLYNLVDDDHPVRKEMYNEICKLLNLPHINWDPSLSNLYTANCRVSNYKIKAEGYQLRFPHRVLL